MATEPMTDARLAEIRKDHAETEGSAWSPNLSLNTAKAWINDLHYTRSELLAEVDRLRTVPERDRLRMELADAAMEWVGGIKDVARGGASYSAVAASRKMRDLAAKIEALHD